MSVYITILDTIGGIILVLIFSWIVLFGTGEGG